MRSTLLSVLFFIALLSSGCDIRYHVKFSTKDGNYEYNTYELKLPVVKMSVDDSPSFYPFIKSIENGDINKEEGAPYGKKELEHGVDLVVQKHPMMYISSTYDLGIIDIACITNVDAYQATCYNKGVCFLVCGKSNGSEKLIVNKSIIKNIEDLKNHTVSGEVYGTLGHVYSELLSEHNFTIHEMPITNISTTASVMAFKNNSSVNAILAREPHASNLIHGSENAFSLADSKSIDLPIYDMVIMSKSKAVNSFSNAAMNLIFDVFYENTSLINGIDMEFYKSPTELLELLDSKEFQSDIEKSQNIVNASDLLELKCKVGFNYDEKNDLSFSSVQIKEFIKNKEENLEIDAETQKEDQVENVK